MAVTTMAATVAYVTVGWAWVDALYMVVITIFGVGYGEVGPVETPGMKLLTMAVIGAGCSSMLLVAGGLVQCIAEGEVRRFMGAQKRNREVNRLSDHTIICGFGRVGRVLATELRSRDQACVILDRDPDKVDDAQSLGFLAVEGDATDDNTLQELGLFRARTLATVLPDDSLNLFITLSARDLCESVRIIARAESLSTERKLILGGASHVVMPAVIGAMQIAKLSECNESDRPALSEERFRMVEQKAEAVREPVA